MRLGLWVAVAGVATMVVTGTAQAAPIGAPQATLQSAIDVGPAPQIELVRGGCGYGRHRTIRGCRINRGLGYGRIYHRYYYRRRFY